MINAVVHYLNVSSRSLNFPSPLFNHPLAYTFVFPSKMLVINKAVEMVTVLWQACKPIHLVIGLLVFFNCLYIS